MSETRNDGLPENSSVDSLTASGAHLSLLLLVLVPLVVARKWERPRRNCTVWMCDVLRSILAVGLVELLTFALLVSVRLEHHHHHQYDGTQRPHRSRLVRCIVTSLLSRLIEVAPGLVLVGWLDKWLLRVAYHAKKLCLKVVLVVSKFKSLERRVGGFGWFEFGKRLRVWRLVEGEITGIETYELDDPFNKHGFVSGNYGFPIRGSWVFQQVCVQSISIAVVRLLAIYIVRHYLGGIVERIAKWWTTRAGFRVRASMAGLLVSFLLYSIELVAMDYMFKFRRNTDADNIVGAIYSLRSYYPLESTRTEEELHEVISSPSFNAYLPRSQSVPELSLPASPVASPLRNVPLVSRLQATEQLQGLPQEEGEQLQPLANASSIGVVTASLLHSAAVGSTVSRISPLLSSPPPPQMHMNSITNETTNDEPQLPSYDDSQREHAGLTTSEAFARARVIAEMKNSPSSSL
ncbi:hypothetical protein TRVA0_027S00826 [Trichomonascus vanleenenianus]|uniref:uncharacterized protein n=1 Tax=Trichomonascus vanleenenianus TaxID=2268995 RepID=UPI003ECB3789